MPRFPSPWIRGAYGRVPWPGGEFPGILGACPLLCSQDMVSHRTQPEGCLCLLSAFLSCEQDQPEHTVLTLNSVGRPAFKELEE